MISQEHGIHKGTFSDARRLWLFSVETLGLEHSSVSFSLLLISFRYSVYLLQRILLDFSSVTSLASLPYLTLCHPSAKIFSW